MLILLLMLIGTMLCCDAWFDVGTSLATSGLWISLLSAVFAELPLAFLAFAGARRLLRPRSPPASWPTLRRRHGLASQPAGGHRPGVGYEWGRSCAGQSLRRAPLAYLGSRRGPAAAAAPGDGRQAA